MIDPWKFEKELGPAPTGYIPGVGRGAIGFITRSDIGTVITNNNTTEESILEEDEIDKVWEEVDKKLKRKEKQEEKEDIRGKFSDLKKGLEKVSEEEWMNIPEIGNYSIKKRKIESYTPVPDQHLIPEIRQVKEKILTNELNKKEITGMTTVHPETYLNEMDQNNQMNDINNLKKVRELLKNLTTSNPTNGSAWITACKIEEGSGKISSARNIIMKSLEYCYDQEDIWLEAIRLNNTEISKSLLSKAVEHLPKSIKLWICAANLEQDKNNKKKIYKKALTQIPNSVQLWKDAIELEENEQDVKMMLNKACELIPNSYELWIALARLENYENAKKVLNKARQYIPTEVRIWISACELEEENGNKNIKMILEKALKSLKQQNVKIEREKWIEYAELSEKGKHLETCKNIIELNLSNDLNQEKEFIFLEDGIKSFKKGYLNTSKFIFQYALNLYPKNIKLWFEYFKILEYSNHSKELLINIQKSIEINSDSEELNIFYLKKLIESNQFDESRKLLKNLKSKKMILIGIKMELKQNNFENVKKLLELGRIQFDFDKFWIKSVEIEKLLNNEILEKEYIEKGLEKYPSSFQLWIFKGKYEQERKEYEKARNIYLNGIKNCPNSIELWKLAILLEEFLKNLPRARALIEKAHQKNPKNELLWEISIEFEKRNGNLTSFYLSKALQECPQSGLLWSISILLESKPKQKSRCALALEKCDKNVYIFLTISRLFWRDRKLINAREWFQKTIQLDKQYGDVWFYYYQFELENGNHLNQFEIQFQNFNPKYGQLWLSLKKNIQNYNLSNLDILKKGLKEIEILK